MGDTDHGLLAPAIVVVPTYNEAQNLPLLLGDITGQQPDLDILVVDDASPDGTGQVAEQWAARDPRIRVLHRPAKQGLAKAYFDAFARVLADPRDYALIIQMDADRSHPVSALTRLRAAAANADLALGSRWVAGGATVAWPWWRRSLSRLGSGYARTVLGLPLRDLTSGFKCFRRAALAAVVERGVQTVGYGFQIEVTATVAALGYRVCEVPITFTERALGASKMTREIAAEAFVAVWRMRQQIARMRSP